MIVLHLVVLRFSVVSVWICCYCIECKLSCLSGTWPRIFEWLEDCVVNFVYEFMNVTVSEALLMSSATTIVLSGGCFLLKPAAIVFVILCKAVVVE